LISAIEACGIGNFAARISLSIRWAWRWSRASSTAVRKICSGVS
jgi:hypothetical protein